MIYEPKVKVPDIQEPGPIYSSLCPYLYLPISYHGYGLRRMAAADYADHETGAQNAKMATAAAC